MKIRDLRIFIAETKNNVELGSLINDFLLTKLMHEVLHPFDSHIYGNTDLFDGLKEISKGCHYDFFKRLKRETLSFLSVYPLDLEIAEFKYTKPIFKSNATSKISCYYACHSAHSVPSRG